MKLENDLRRALRRESPPAGFAARVVARIEVEERRSRLSGRARLPILHWWRAAAASVTLAALLGGVVTHRALERRRGEIARKELLRALTIAGEKVRYAQQEVRGIGSR